MINHLTLRNCKPKQQSTSIAPDQPYSTTYNNRNTTTQQPDPSPQLQRLNPNMNPTSPTTAQPASPYEGHTITAPGITMIKLPLRHQHDGKQILYGQRFSPICFAHPVIRDLERPRKERCPNCQFLLEDRRAVYGHFSQCVLWNGNRNAVSWYDGMNVERLDLGSCTRLVEYVAIVDGC